MQKMLSKSSLLYKLVGNGMIPEKYHHRLIFGSSPGTVDDPVTNGIDVCEAAQPFADTVRCGRSVPRVEVERGLDLVIVGDEAQLEGA